MRPSSWHPPLEPSSFEQTIMTRIKRAKLFVFLRHYRHELFDDAFQEELAALYAPSRRGQPPIPPAQLALATIVQAYTGVSDDEVIEATLMDQNQEFGSRALRAALDSSPLWGAGRVEDTYNLLGHALKKAMRVVADQQGRELVEIAKEAGAELVCERSLKAALDRDWDQQTQKDEALGLVLNVLRAVETWVQTLQQEDALLAQPSLSIAQQVKDQDVQVDEKGKESLIWRCIAKPGPFARANTFPSKLSPWIGNGRLSVVPLSRRCPLYPVEWSIFPKRPVPHAFSKSNVPPVPTGAVSASILMKPCSLSYESANKPCKDAPNCANG